MERNNAIQHNSWRSGYMSAGMAYTPTWEEFNTLKGAVGGDGNALKKGIGGGQGTNTSGFSALLTGFRCYDGNFCDLGGRTYFWSSSGSCCGAAFNM